MKYIAYYSGQYIFDRLSSGVLMALKVAGNCIVYFPQLFTGYCITRCILNKQDNGITWVLLTMLFAFILYLFVFFLKGILIVLKTKKNFWWLPLFILCALYTCVLPVMLFFGLLHKAAFYFTIDHADELSWLFAIVACSYLYSKYAFLTDCCPKIALPGYRAGVSISMAICGSK
jgi:hypothetical protein